MRFMSISDACSNTILFSYSYAFCILSLSLSLLNSFIWNEASFKVVTLQYGKYWHIHHIVWHAHFSAFQYHNILYSKYGNVNAWLNKHVLPKTGTITHKGVWQTIFLNLQSKNSNQIWFYIWNVLTKNA